MSFEINDRVKVVDKGKIFPDYEEIGNKYLLEGWEKGRRPLRLTTFKVIGLETHTTDGKALAVIQNASGQVYIIRETGIELAYKAGPVCATPPPTSESEPFTFPDWINIKSNDGPKKRGLVVDKRKFGNADNAACWVEDVGAQWSCNQSFRYHLTPEEAAMMLLALAEARQ